MGLAAKKGAEKNAVRVITSGSEEHSSEYGHTKRESYIDDYIRNWHENLGAYSPEGFGSRRQENDNTSSPRQRQERSPSTIPGKSERDSQTLLFSIPTNRVAVFRQEKWISSEHPNSHKSVAHGQSEGACSTWARSPYFTSLFCDTPTGNGSRSPHAADFAWPPKYYEHGALLADDQHSSPSCERKDGRTLKELSVANVLKLAIESKDDVLSSLNCRAKSIIAKIINCASGAFGYIRRKCLACNNEDFVAFCGCGDRNCPECGKKKRQEWAEDVSKRFRAPVAFHVVFTIPHELNLLVKLNKNKLLGLLIKASADTLLTFSSDKSKGKPYLMTVLHTWNQSLGFHPHVHALISAGVLTNDGKWTSSNSKFLFPVAQLAKVFRGKYMSQLNILMRTNKLQLPANIGETEKDIQAFLRSVPNEWHVYCQPPYKSNNVLIRYFAQYANRTAISNSRIFSVDDNEVAIKPKRDKCEPGQTRKKSKMITMSFSEFLKRFSEHILPRGFKRIRYYGLMSPKLKQETKDLLVDLLPIQPEPETKKAEDTLPSNKQECSRCKSTNCNIEIIRKKPGHNRPSGYFKKRMDSS